jgi:hypothetical protein
LHSNTPALKQNLQKPEGFYAESAVLSIAFVGLVISRENFPELIHKAQAAHSSVEKTNLRRQSRKRWNGNSSATVIASSHAGQSDDSHTQYQRYRITLGLY